MANEVIKFVDSVGLARVWAKVKAEDALKVDIASSVVGTDGVNGIRYNGGKLQVYTNETWTDAVEAQAIDTTITEGGVNPVTGGAIFTALAGKVNTSDVDTVDTKAAITTTNTKLVQAKAIADKFGDYVTTASITSTVEAGNTNPVTSGGVATALGDYVPTADIDTVETKAAITTTNEKLVKAKAIADALADKVNTADVASTVTSSGTAPVTSAGIYTFVTDAITVADATYISNNGEPFASVAALEAYTGAHDKNDYAYVATTDAAGNTVYSKYKFNGTAWAKEYDLNNNGFTAAQWANINAAAMTNAEIDAICV